MSHYVFTCVFLFSLDALLKMFVVAIGRDSRSQVQSMIGLALDVLTAVVMIIWGLALLLK
jgi:hypothetical protein